MILQSLMYVVTRLIQAAITMAVLAAYTRILSPSEYGEYSAVNAGVMLAYGSLFNWLATSLLRVAPAAKDRGALLASILIIYCTVVCCVGALAALFWTVSAQTVDPVLLAIGVALFATIGWLELNYSLLASSLNAAKYSLMSVLRAVLVSLLGGTLAYMGYGTSGALIGGVVGMLVPGLLLLNSEWRTISLRGVDWSFLPQLLAYGLPMALSLTLYSLAVNSDRLLLGLLTDSHTLGLYASRFELADRLISGFMAAVAIAAFPRAVRELDLNGREAANIQLNSNLILVFALGAPLVVGICAIAQTLSTVLIGSQFQEVPAFLIAIIAVSSFIGSLRTYYFDHAFQLAKNSSSMTVVMMVIAASAILLNLIFIPNFGLWGAVMAMLGTHLMGLFVCFRLGRKVYQLPIPVIKLAKVASAAVIMGLIVHFLPGSDSLEALFGKGLVGGVSYLGLLVIFGVVERDVLLAIYRRIRSSA